MIEVNQSKHTTTLYPKVALHTIQAFGMTIRFLHKVIRIVEPWGILLVVVALILATFQLRDSRDLNRAIYLQMLLERIDASRGQFNEIDMGLNLVMEATAQAGVSMSGLNLSQLLLSNADLDYADLSDANLSNARLRQISLVEADLTKSNLSTAAMWSANLTNTTLNYANLSGSNLKNATLNDASLIGATLDYVDLRNASLFGANLTGASLKHAIIDETDFSDAKLVDSNLELTTISRSCFDGTDFADAELAGVKFYSVDLRHAIGLAQEQLSHVCARDSHLPPNYIIQRCLNYDGQDDKKETVSCPAKGIPAR